MSILYSIHMVNCVLAFGSEPTYIDLLAKCDCHHQLVKVVFKLAFHRIGMSGKP